MDGFSFFIPFNLFLYINQIKGLSFFSYTKLIDVGKLQVSKETPGLGTSASEGYVGKSNDHNFNLSYNLFRKKYQCKMVDKIEHFQTNYASIR